MSILVISDTHLARRFNRKKFNLLKKLFSTHDEIFLIGDFWEGYSLDFDQFLKSKWNHLFNYMKDKTIYIPGNHDKPHWTDNRTSQFSLSTHDEYKRKIGKREFTFKHGHIVTDYPKYDFGKLMPIFRIIYPNFLAVISMYINSVLWPNYPIGIERYLAKESEKILIIGHMHRERLKSNENFIVNGRCFAGELNYLIINQKGEITTHQKKYGPF